MRVKMMMMMMMRWWWWLVATFWPHGRLNGNEAKSKMKHTLDIPTRRASNWWGSDLWSNALPVEARWSPSKGEWTNHIVVTDGRGEPQGQVPQIELNWFDSKPNLDVSATLFYPPCWGDVQTFSSEIKLMIFIFLTFHTLWRWKHQME